MVLRNHPEIMQNKNLFKFILFIGDIVLMYSALLLTLAIRYGDFSFWPGPQTRVFLWHFSFISLFWLFFLSLLDFYEIPPFKEIFDFFSNLIIFGFLAGTMGVVYFYLYPQAIITPKTILLLDVLIFTFFLCAWRYVFSRILKLQSFKEKIAIIGFQPEMKELLTSSSLQESYEIVIFFAPNLHFSNGLKPFSNLGKRGITSEIPQLREIIEKDGVNSMVFALNSRKNEDLVKQIFLNLPLKLNFISFPSFYELITKKVPLMAIDEFWFLENLSRSEKKLEEVMKRGFDIIFSFLGLLITAILFPFIALAIKIDSPGPVFYIQKRVGKDGRTFPLYKFRTMKADAEKMGPQWSIPNDPRITRVGKILRSIYLDEFPQFYNIFKGDISFVGPRPERPEFVSQLKEKIPYYNIRHLVKPGFTGWAQINYHYSASVNETKEKLQYDLYYIKHRSFFLDLGIILKTIRIIFR